jgi:drug/metabolite transporter (DMT)-like permease
VLAIVLALASAIGYGGSDFAAGLASRSAGVIQVTLLASMVSAVIVAAALPFAASHPPGTAALAWGAVAGLGGTTGALALYLGFRHAAFSVAGPISAVGAAGFSVLAGLLLGERPTALALTGIVLALPAIVGVSASAASADSEPREEETADAATAEETADADAAEETADAAGRPAAAGRPTAAGSPATGVAAGLVAGAGFALLFIGLDRAGSGSGLWPVAATQVTELVVALAVATVTRNVRLPGTRRRGTQPSGTRRPGAQLSGTQLSGAQLSGTGPRLLAVIAGAAGASGTILFFFASHEGFLAITAVLTSLYPAVTIVLARTMLGERLTALRLAGLTLAGACVALIAVGSVG